MERCKRILMVDRYKRKLKSDCKIVIERPSSVMNFNFTAYPICASGHNQVERFNHSHYILLPSTILLDIDGLFEEQPGGPLLFSLRNPTTTDVCYCGVLEFSDEPGVCYLPLHIFQKLHLEYGDMLTARLYTCDTGTHIHLRPEEFAFVQLPNPKEILEKAIVEYYPVISENDTLTICHQDRKYQIQVTKTLPELSIKTFHCDISVELEEPHDMQHIVPPPSPPPAEVAEVGEVEETVMANEVITYNTDRFPGQGRTLGSS